MIRKRSIAASAAALAIAASAVVATQASASTDTGWLKVEAQATCTAGPGYGVSTIRVAARGTTAQSRVGYGVHYLNGGHPDFTNNDALRMGTSKSSVITQVDESPLVVTAWLDPQGNGYVTTIKTVFAPSCS